MSDSVSQHQEEKDLENIVSFRDFLKSFVLFSYLLKDGCFISEEIARLHSNERIILLPILRYFSTFTSLMFSSHLESRREDCDLGQVPADLSDCRKAFSSS